MGRAEEGHDRQREVQCYMKEDEIWVITHDRIGNLGAWGKQKYIDIRKALCSVLVRNLKEIGGRIFKFAFLVQFYVYLCVDSTL